VKEIEIIIRSYQSQIDDPYIYSTWRKYAWYSPKEKICVSKGQFFKEKIEEIKKILSQGIIKIACFKNEPIALMGFIVAHEGKIAALFVKKDYLKEGIPELLKNSIKDQLNE
jgi:hypothetical protein